MKLVIIWKYHNKLLLFISSSNYSYIQVVTDFKVSQTVSEEWYQVARCSKVQCCVARCSVVWCVAQCCMVWCDVLWFSVILETSTSQTNYLNAIKLGGCRQMYTGR